MTAPSRSHPATTHPAALRIGLERFLNPQHLPLLAVRDWEWGQSGDFSVVLEAPDQQGNGFAALERGRCDLITACPLQLTEARASGCEALGCFLESHGGVLMREDRIGKFRGGEVVHIAASLSSPLTDGLCRRILQSWAGAQGWAVAETQILVEPAAADPVDQLVSGCDGVWLAFSDVDEISARQRGLSLRMLTADQAGFPEFAALELVARKRRSAEEIALHERFVAAMDAATTRLRKNPEEAVALWSAAAAGSGTKAIATTEAADVVRATLACLKSPMNRQADRWNALFAAFADA